MGWRALAVDPPLATCHCTSRALNWLAYPVPQFSSHLPLAFRPGRADASGRRSSLKSPARMMS
jgi:hypothetical protein